MRARDATRIHARSWVRRAHLVAAERAESGGRLTSECLGDPFIHRPPVRCGSAGLRFQSAAKLLARG